MEKAVTGQKACCRPLIKSAWVELINEKQIEINCTIMLGVETYDEGEVVLLEKPHFVDKPKEKEYPMVIVTMKQGETLWELANATARQKIISEQPTIWRKSRNGAAATDRQIVCL